MRDLDSAANCLATLPKQDVIWKCQEVKGFAKLGSPPPVTMATDISLAGKRRALSRRGERLISPLSAIVYLAHHSGPNMATSAAASTVDERKKAIWLRTQERYQACADVPEEKQKEKEQEQNKTEKASLSQQIDSGNKGFQLLAKLGWNEGETLGKNEDGLKEPIGLLTNVGTSGLGSKPLKKPGGGEQLVRGGREKTIWKKTQEKRKPVVQTVNLFEASDSE